MGRWLRQNKCQGNVRMTRGPGASAWSKDKGCMVSRELLSLANTFCPQAVRGRSHPSIERFLPAQPKKILLAKLVSAHRHSANADAKIGRMTEGHAGSCTISTAWPQERYTVSLPPAQEQHLSVQGNASIEAKKKILLGTWSERLLFILQRVCNHISE